MVFLKLLGIFVFATIPLLVASLFPKPVTIRILPGDIAVNAQNLELQSCEGIRKARTSNITLRKLVIDELSFINTGLEISLEKRWEDISGLVNTHRIFYKKHKSTKWFEVIPSNGTGKYAAITRKLGKKSARFHVTIRIGNEIPVSDPLEAMKYPKSTIHLGLPITSTEVQPSSSVLSEVGSQSDGKSADANGHINTYPTTPEVPSHVNNSNPASSLGDVPLQLPPTIQASASGLSASQSSIDPQCAPHTISNANSQEKLLRPVVVEIGLLNVYEQFAYRIDFGKHPFGRLAAWENFNLLITDICRNPTRNFFCVGDTFLVHSFPSLIHSIDTHRKSENPQIDIHILDLQSTELGNFIYAPYGGMTSNEDYWVYFSELRKYVNELIERLRQMKDISGFRKNRFMQHKKLPNLHQKPPMVFKSLKYISQTKAANFEIGARKIGSGNQGEVRLGRSLVNGEEVVIKIQISMRNDSRGNENAKLLAKEINVYDKINNRIPGIVSMITTGDFSFELEKRHYTNELYDPEKMIWLRPLHSSNEPVYKTHAMVMERLGLSLDELIKPDRKIVFTENIIRTIMVSMFDTIRQMHEECNILNRDIKLQNFMIDFKTNRIKMVDFGIAKEFKPSTKSNTRKKSIIGTLDYMSFNCLSFRRLKPGDDLESLALTFYHFVTKREPITEGLRHRYAEIMKSPNILITYRENLLGLKDDSYVEKIVFPFYNMIRIHNDNVAKSEDGNLEITKPPYDALREILTGETFTEHLPEGWIPRALVASQCQKIVQPEKDLVRVPIGKTLPSPVEQFAMQKFSANFAPDFICRGIGILIDLNLLYALDDEGDIVIQSGSNITKTIRLQNKTEEFLASICSYFNCVLVTNLHMVEAHLFYRMPMFAHYFRDVFWNYYVEDVGNFMKMLDESEIKREKLVLIQAKNQLFTDSSVLVEKVAIVTHDEGELDTLIDSVYASIQDVAKK